MRMGGSHSWGGLGVLRAEARLFAVAVRSAALPERYTRYRRSAMAARTCHGAGPSSQQIPAIRAERALKVVVGGATALPRLRRRGSVVRLQLGYGLGKAGDAMATWTWSDGVRRRGVRISG